MKSDSTTKSLLALITIFLAVIALRPSLLHGTGQAQATDYAGVQFSVLPEEDAFFNFFDSKTGDVWTYDRKGNLVDHHKLNGLGRPMMTSSR
ncbi:MAG TPA: hypothetical protein VMH88_12095 [Gemmatimonadales bacterium]|nr:hypothetical protein [Gemmatimonadales bacterium]